MASDNHAHYARIGFIVVIGVAAIVATLVYLGGFHDPNSEFLVETYYDHPVNGLSVGSPVNLFGVKIGEVREISFASTTYGDAGANSNDFGRVCIVMALNKRQLGYDNLSGSSFSSDVRESARDGLRATVSVNGITGLARIDLKVVENPPPTEPLGWTPRYPLILSSPSLLDSFAVAATKLVNKLKTMDFDVVWSNVNRTADAAARTAENADAMLEGSRASVRQIVGDVGEASAALKEMSMTLKNNPSLMVRPSDPEILPETAR